MLCQGGSTSYMRIKAACLITISTSLLYMNATAVMALIPEISIRRLCGLTVDHHAV